MGHPDAAYELDPDAQARLLGWLFARTKMATPKKKGSDPGCMISGVEMLNRLRRGAA